MKNGKVYTWRLSKRNAHDAESENAKCHCGRFATYWSQKEGPGGKPLGGVVYHCQACRAWGREKAETQPVQKMNKKILQLISQLHNQRGLQ